MGDAISRAGYLKECQRLLKGKKIVDISFVEYWEDGFTVSCEDGVELSFGFRGDMGEIVLIEQRTNYILTREIG